MTVPRLEDYRDVAPRGTIDLLLRLAERLRGRRFVHVSAGRYGDGAPALLERLVPMLQDLGVEASWEVLVGDPAFFEASRALDQAVAGLGPRVTPRTLAACAETVAANAATLPLEADMVMTHDLATLPLARHRPARGRWIWRCHEDLSRTARGGWSLLREEVERHDAVVYSLPKFAQRVRVPMLVVAPSIDPLSEKNRELTRAEVRQALDRLAVPRDKPLLLQVGPFSRAADPLAAVAAARLVRRYTPCRLIVAGWGALDHPEGATVLAEVREAAGADGDVQILLLPPDAGQEINALQRAAAVVVHTPQREDFGLAVAEAMWKGKPVVGSPAGGVPAQIIPDVTGYVVASVEGAAFRIRHLLQNPDLAARLGGAGREHVRRSFLLPRHLGDYLAILASVAA